jgi:hypothetical protein
MLDDPGLLDFKTADKLSRRAHFIKRFHVFLQKSFYRLAFISKKLASLIKDKRGKRAKGGGI